MLIVLWVLSALFYCGEVCAGGRDYEAVDAAHEAELLAVVGDGFRVRGTRHFVIAYNTDEEVLRDFIKRVEATYRSVFRFLDVNEIGHQTPSERLEILFFAKYEQFARYAATLGWDASGTAGFYEPTGNRSAFFHVLDDPALRAANDEIEGMTKRLQALARNGASEQRSELAKSLRNKRFKRDNLIEKINQLVVQHEVAHMVLFNCGVHVRGGQNPLWLVEGLACLFEPPPDKYGAGLGTINQFRLHGFRESLSAGPEIKPLRVSDINTAFRSEKFVPLNRLVGDRRSLSMEEEHITARYAQAWSLVYYLQQRHREELSRYVREVSKRRPGERVTRQEELDVFESVFGPIDEEFMRFWVEFILSRQYIPPRL